MLSIFLFRLEFRIVKYKITHKHIIYAIRKYFDSDNFKTENCSNEKSHKIKSKENDFFLSFGSVE